MIDTNSQITRLQLTSIGIDTTVQPRIGGLDPDHVVTLQEAAESWPPLVVVEHQRRYVLVDGFHRFAAAQNLDLASVPVRVVDLPTDGDLHALAFALNAAHGRPLSLADRRAFASRLLHQHPDWANREIGRRCGLSSNTVGAIREQLEHAAQIERTETRVGAGGYVYTAGTNPKQRQPGELPEVGLGAMVGEAVGRLFSPTERIRQRKITGYLQRLAVALEDQGQLEGWDVPEDVAEACRLVLGAEHATALAQRLGSNSSTIIAVAWALGYEEEAGE